MKAYYIKTPEKNVDLIRRLLLPLNASEEEQMKGAIDRVKALIKQPNLRIVFEREVEKDL